MVMSTVKLSPCFVEQPALFRKVPRAKVPRASKICPEEDKKTAPKEGLLYLLRLALKKLRAHPSALHTRARPYLLSQH